MKRFFFFFVFVFQYVVFLTGQTIFPESKFFSVTEGLSQSRITSLLQDSKGFLWIGTEDGLNRYDGYEFKNYANQPFDTNSLSNNRINAIAEDKDGVLWIATNKGLNSLNVVNGEFRCYYHNPYKSNTVSSNAILNVFIDSENVLWVKTLKSLDMFDPITQTFRRFPHYHDVFHFVADNVAYPISEDKKGRLWVGTKDGLNNFDRDLELFNRSISLEYNQKSLSNNEIRAISVDKNGIFWVGTANGLNSFNPDKKEFQRFYPDPGAKQFSNVNRINTLYHDKSGQLWVGTADGLYTFNKLTGEFRRYLTRNTKELQVSIHSILEDNSGVFWVGTLKGLVKVGLRKQKFRVYRNDDDKRIDFSSYDISSIYIDDKENVWLGTWGRGINILNRATSQVQKIDFQLKGINEDNIIHYIFKVAPEQYWVGTNNGIMEVNPLTNEYKNLCVKNIAGCNSLFQNRVNSICKDKQSNYWIATNNGLYKLDLTSKVITPYLNNPEVKNSICDNDVYCILPDSKGNLWIGTGNGLDYLSLPFGQFTHYDKRFGNKPFLSSTTVYCMQFDQKGNLWVGTASGLNRLNLVDNSIKIITEREGLSDNLIYALLIDNKQNVWVSTNRGLNFINTKTFMVRSFDVSDGLQDYEFNFNAAARNKKGELFFGGVNGLNIFHPDSLVDNKKIPPVVITSIEIVTEFGKVKSLNPFSERVVIPYRTNIFTVSFASLDFTLPEKNSYAYKFYSDNEGDWVSIGTKHSNTFSNLKPGNYVLKIKGSNSDFVWNESGVTIAISVESPFWMKPQAYYIYIFILIALILIFYRYRTFNLRQNNRILREKEIAAREIERQKEQLAIKNRNITDSINYAKRIQEALMPSEKYFKKILPDSFVLHQPKDIVSGDFFWISERGKKIYVAAVDCTGHGVPGAFMSIIGFELFRKITHNQYIDDPSHILNILNREFEEIFKDVDNVTLKDGMDIAFCVIDKETRILEFSGAVNPIYLIREDKITEIRGARFSVGLDDISDDLQTFENKQIVLQEDDVIYLFSDGYADQFGGPEGKKFKYRRFRHLLLTIHQYPMDEQQRLLLERINRWKGNFEQVDDILVIGFRPNFLK